MRGTAALVAAAAVWLLVTRHLPAIPWRIPRQLPIRRAAAAMGTAAVVAVAAEALAASWALALALGVLAAGVPGAIGSARRARAVTARADRWPDLLAALRGHLSGGATVADALLGAGRQVGGPLREPMVRIEAALGAGTPFPDALEAERHRLADPLADRVLITLAAAHRTGGATVSALLERLASSVAEELRVRKAHDADLTQQRLTAAVALLAPWGLLVLTILTNAQAAAAYRTERGSIVILVGLAATAGGHLLSRRTARLSRAPRVFT